MKTMNVPSRMYLFNNPSYSGSAWTWLHSGCNDRAQVTFEGTRYADIVSKPCTCFHADDKFDEFGAFLKSVTLWLAEDVASTQAAIKPVIGRNMDRMLFSLADRQQWVDTTTLPGGGNNLEDNVLMREFQREVQQLLGY